LRKELSHESDSGQRDPDRCGGGRARTPPVGIADRQRALRAKESKPAVNSADPKRELPETVLRPSFP